MTCGKNMRATQGYYSKLQCDLNFALDQLESKFNTHKVTSSPKSPCMTTTCTWLLTQQESEINLYSPAKQFALHFSPMSRRKEKSTCTQQRLYTNHPVVRVLIRCVVCNDVNFDNLMFYELFSLKNMVLENHGLLSGIDIVPFSIHQPLKMLNPNGNRRGLYYDTTCRSECTIAKNVYHFISVTKNNSSFRFVYI